MRIGSLTFDDITILAPLAGVTNLPFRLMVKAAGCGLVCTEMISANGLVHNSWKTQKLMESVSEEKPLSVQLFGADPDIMAEAAVMVAESGADILDVNFGCSVKKILKTGSGSALMKDPHKSENILKMLRKAVQIPLTIKIRSGWDSSGAQAIRLATIAQDVGVDAIAVHPRTATQGFGGTADWRIIKAVKQAVEIPVIGNGDILEAADALAMQQETGCDGIMIGRAALSNPWIFSQVSALLQGRSPTVVDNDMRFDAMVDYVKSSVIHFGEIHACRMMRSRLGWFVKGLRNSSKFRDSLKHLSTQADAIDLLMAYKKSLNKSYNRSNSFSITS